MHEALVNRLGGLSLPRKSVVRLTDRTDMTLDVYRGRKTTMQQQQQLILPSRASEIRILFFVGREPSNMCEELFKNYFYKFSTILLGASLSNSVGES